MFKNVSLFLIIIITFSCDKYNNNHNDEYNEYRIIAWKSLGAENDNNYIGSWEDGIVTEYVNSEIKIPTVFVEFEHIKSKTNGPYGVYIIKETKSVINSYLLKFNIE